MGAGGRSRGRGRRGTGVYDQALKILGERWAPEMAALLLPQARLEGPLAGELPATGRRVDWLWRARVGDEPCALHVEFQLRGKPDMARRMFEYGARIFAQHDLLPLAALVYLVPTRPLAQAPFAAGLAGTGVFFYRFTVVRLWEVDPAPIVAGELGGLTPLVPLMRGAAPEQLPALAERVLGLPGLDALQRGDLLSILATFGALRFPAVDVWEELRRSAMLSEVIEELIEDSPFLRKIHDDAETQGRLEAVRALARDIAMDRFPDLAPAELEMIDRVGAVERLHALARALTAAADIEAARRALREAGA